MARCVGHGDDRRPEVSNGATMASATARESFCGSTFNAEIVPAAASASAISLFDSIPAPLPFGCLRTAAVSPAEGDLPRTNAGALEASIGGPRSHRLSFQASAQTSVHGGRSPAAAI